MKNLPSKENRIRKIATKVANRVMNGSEEKKWRQIANNSIVSGYDGTVSQILLNALNIGTTREQRIANKVKLAQLQVFLTIAAAAKVTSRVRCVIFIDKQTNGSTANWGVNDLFAGIGVLDTSSMMTPLNPDMFPRRFTKLQDKIITVGVEGGATDVAIEKTHIFNCNVKNKVIQYNTNNSGSVTDIISGAIYIVCLSSTNVANAPAVTARTLLRFTDA